MAWQAGEQTKEGRGGGGTSCCLGPWRLSLSLSLSLVSVSLWRACSHQVLRAITPPSWCSHESAAAKATQPAVPILHQSAVGRPPRSSGSRPNGSGARATTRQPNAVAWQQGSRAAHRAGE